MEALRYHDNPAPHFDMSIPPCGTLVVGSRKMLQYRQKGGWRYGGTTVPIPWIMEYVSFLDMVSVPDHYRIRGYHVSSQIRLGILQRSIYKYRFTKNTSQLSYHVSATFLLRSEYHLSTEYYLSTHYLVYIY